MLNLRRRSSPRTKELIHAPVRIHVASQETEMGHFQIGESRTEPSNDKELGKLDLECPDSGVAKLYLEHYFNFLHCVGLASFKEYWKTKTAPTYIIHRGLFLLLGTLAILDAVKFIKVSSVLYVPYGKMYRCVVFARYCLNCAKRIYFLTVVSAGSKKISEMFSELDALGKGLKHIMKRAKTLAYGIGMVSFLAAIILPLFGWAIIGQEMSLSNVILRPSFEISLSVFVWTTNSTEMLEQYADLHQYYAQDFTAVTMSLGIMGIVMEFLGCLFDNANNDIMLFSAMTLHKLTTEFQQKIQQTDSNMDTTMREYRQLQKASACIEKAFGRLFKISHATNLFSCAYFVMILVSIPIAEYNIALILLALQILKVWLSYTLASKSSLVNKCFREWVRSLIIAKNQLEYDSDKTTALLESSMESPIGLGSETFFVDEIFLLKFATMVGTFSLFLINSEKEFEVG